MAGAASAAKPILLTVDDDPAVSRAVARDLRRHYGEDYRVLRASSAAEALDALKEVKLRGERVAAILADYRMPQMNGIEFLEQAMDLFPRARRALLTAYADTDAAIQAINVVDVDHYLLKPWDPPEDKLYPVVDSLLETWQALGDSPVDEVKVVGHRWNARSHGVRDFLARNSVPYRWYASDEPEGRRLLEAAGATGDDVPLVVPPSGEALRAPDNATLAAAVGLSTEPSVDFYDLVIVGGGPAGLGAAVYGASEGLKTVLVEREATGGQAGTSSRIENYLGFPDGVSGGQLTERARRQALKFGAELLTTRDVVRLETRGPARVVHFADGSELSAHAVVIATGVSYRRLPASGADDFQGRGLYYGSSATEAPACSGKDVYIVGGANSAGQAAVFFSSYARRVVLLVRGPGLEATMSHYLIEQLAGIENVEVRTCTEVVEAHGDEHLERLGLRDSATGEVELVETPYCFVFIGAEPRTDWLDGVVSRDERGFVRTGPDLVVEGRKPAGWNLDREPFYLETSVPGVFVAGDVRSASVKRVASAVGEGAMAVTLVHRYLDRS
ncbi:thioredoxin reductase (NADPH) [Motilibacter peucedani]|uniref:Thioredoxin reductase (NADPH) n=1 Tax=Motilibacter peucedani TaxID=598650 RepID=A0A420XMX9_9ACTN|nr:FAD-dependent oxidoreductase [Motilibacter peucedani]RKS72633.1 thioredoxin reductase (NADPH) [Motilibacter peucedani]